jgi:hypothetical protein
MSKTDEFVPAGDLGTGNQYDWATDHWATGPVIRKVEAEFAESEEGRRLHAVALDAQNAYWKALRAFGWRKREELSCPTCGNLGRV